MTAPLILKSPDVRMECVVWCKERWPGKGQGLPWGGGKEERLAGVSWEVGSVLVLDPDGGYVGVAFLKLSICVLCIFIDVYCNTLQ